MANDRQIARYVSSLASVHPPRGFRNPYVQPAAAHNLRTFLYGRERTARTLMLVGEAPGYKGAAISGVALSSVSTLTEAWGDPWGAFGPLAGYKTPPSARHNREATATIVWTSLSRILQDIPLPLTWNAVPYHPIGISGSSNAPLAKRDVALGVPWLERLLELFPNSVPVAVGNRACDALKSLGISHHGIRHPARGGKASFTQGLRGVKRSLEGPHAQDSPACSRCLLHE